MSAPPQILELAARFERQLDAYRSGQYNETQLRREFLDPLFKALGWDMDNEQGYAEAYKDVIHEDAIRIGGAVKAPDYCFRIGGARKFFLEAKKPSVCIKDEPSAAYQLRRYAWSAKLPLSLLSDFEEFAVYDCRVKPHKDDPAATARIFYCTFRELAEKWDWIADRFSRDAVLKGSFDKFAESSKGKRGTSEVDAAFLETIEGWRLELARNLALRNPKLSQRELNFAVQRIIDRIIFLRICEDRGIEDYGRLRALVNGDRIYPRLAQLFEAADARYNSGLFHFKREKDRHEAPDELTLALELDDKFLRDILRGLYYPDSPYEFSVLSADILGQVYEQFLGKVIRLTEGHRAVVDDKPEVKKAGGVYYTPPYIVDYIVRQTVGKLLEDICGQPALSRALPPHPDPLPPGEPPRYSPENRTPPIPTQRWGPFSLSPGEGRGEGKRDALSPRAAARILDRVSRLRILDPACGSGSFLIGAYQHLLDWHLQFYVRLLGNPEPGRSRGDEGGVGDEVTSLKSKEPSPSLLTSSPTVVQRAHWLLRGKDPPIVQTTKGWKLSIAERKRILLNNIYGVDIDTQAVEVTKLSLLLKVLEGETAQSLQPVFRFSQEHALPDLGDNIKCGNSLIGPDFYDEMVGTDSTPSPIASSADGGSQGRGGTRPYQPTLFGLTDEERYRINVFDWRAEFPHVFRRRTSSGELREMPASPLDFGMPGVPLHGSYSYKKKKGPKAPPPAPAEPEWEGGFDAVIGNPPYVRQESLSDFKDYFEKHYEAFDGVADLYAYFMEQGMKLLRDGGLFSIIVSSSFLRATYGEPLRRTLKKHAAVQRIVDFGGLAVFTNAKDTYVCIPLLARGAKPARVEVSKVTSLKNLKLVGYVAANHFTIPHERLSPEAWSLKSDAEAAVFAKVMKAGKPLGEYVERRFFRGVTSGLNDAFIIDTETKRRLIAKDKRSAELIHPLLGGEDIRRYIFHETGLWLIFTRRGVDIDRYPAIREHLAQWKEDLTPKRDKNAKRGRKPGRYEWYEIQDDVAYYEVFDGPKIIFPDICKGPRFSLDTGGHYLANTAYCLGTDDLYLLGVLNSRLFWFAIGNLSIPFGIRAGEYRYRLIYQYMEKVPIRVIDPSNAADKSRHDRLVELVEQMLALHGQAAAVRTPQEQAALERQIAATDTQVDRLVYDLYGLTEDEIRIVECAA
jgi:type I restriction-modification system DNA methylase subunit